MPAKTIGAEELATLAPFLRGASFIAGAQQFLAAQELLWALADRGREIPREDLGPWLAPIFSNSEAEQERFRLLYKQWTTMAQTVAPEETSTTAARPRYRRPLWWIAGAGAAVLVLTIAVVVQQNSSQTVHPTPIAPSPNSLPSQPSGDKEPSSKDVSASGIVRGDDGKPLADATLWYMGRTEHTNEKGEFQIQGQRLRPVLITHYQYDAALSSLHNVTGVEIRMPHKPSGAVIDRPAIQDTGLAPAARARRARYDRLRLILSAVPPGALLAWSVFVFWKRQALRKWRSQSDSTFARLPVEGAARRGFSESEVQRVVQDMRRPKPIPITELRPERTVTATVENAGWFTPVYHARKATPEYLLLIDREARRDQQEQFASELAKRLKDRGVYLETYYFTRDPRTCFPREAKRAAPLSELAARFGHCQLLIFADGASFFNKFTGRPEPWLGTLEQWSSRVLLTPAPPSEWGYHEQRFIDRGYEVWTADVRGLARLLDASAVARSGTGRYPPSLLDRSHRWTDPEPPRPVDVARLRTELRLYLGPEGTAWFNACAVYPVLEWELTQHLGAALVPARDFAPLLRKLVRLPWFRQGSMPDWLRVALIGAMPPPILRSVRQRLNELLDRTPQTRGASGAGQLELSGGTASGRGPAQDEVFLCFLWGRNPKDLVFSAPGRVRSLLFHRGRVWFGPRPAAALLASLLLGGCIWFGMDFGRPDIPVVAPTLAPVDLLRSRVVDIAVSQLRESSYFLATPPDPNTGERDFPRWCYRVASLVLSPHPLETELKLIAGDPQPGDLVTPYPVRNRPPIFWLAMGRPGALSRVRSDRGQFIQFPVADSGKTDGVLLAKWAVPSVGSPIDPPAAPGTRDPERFTAIRERNAVSVQLLAELLGHKAEVLRAAFSPDGQRILTASADNTAAVWDAATGQLLASLGGYTDNVIHAEFSPAGDRIVTAGWDRAVRLWNAADARILAELRGHTNGIEDAKFSPDGQRIVTASADHTARVWDAADGRVLAKLLGHTAGVLQAAFSPDGQRIVTASADHTARVWDAADGRVLAKLLGHTAGVLQAAFSPDGQRIVTTAYHDNTARVWNGVNGQLLARLEGHSADVMHAEFSPNGLRVVTASKDHTARLWNAANGQLLTKLEGHLNGVEDAEFSPDGERIVTASSDHTARVYRVVVPPDPSNRITASPAVSDEVVSRTWKSPSMNIGCNETHDGQVEAAVPLNPQFENVMSVTAAIVDTDNIKEPQVSSKLPATAIVPVKFSFRGLDRDFIGNCPGGGHASVLVTFRVRRRVPVTSNGQVSGGAQSPVSVVKTP